MIAGSVLAGDWRVCRDITGFLHCTAKDMFSPTFSYTLEIDID